MIASNEHGTSSIITMSIIDEYTNQCIKGKGISIKSMAQNKLRCQDRAPHETEGLYINLTYWKARVRKLQLLEDHSKVTCLNQRQMLDLTRPDLNALVTRFGFLLMTVHNRISNRVGRLGSRTNCLTWVRLEYGSCVMS